MPHLWCQQMWVKLTAVPDLINMQQDGSDFF